MKIRNTIFTWLLAVVLLLSCAAAPAIAAEADGEPIEAAFTDAVFLGEVRKLVGKTDGEHIYYSDVKDITVLDLVYKGITNLQGIEYFTGLEELQCWDNDITELDLSHNTKLKILDCSYNHLTELDLSNNPELEFLDCNNTDLLKLDLRNNPKLKQLICHDAFLRTLNLSNNELLEELDAFYNYLVNLDVSNNPKLEYLDCSHNYMSSIESVTGLESCPLLKENDTFRFKPQITIGPEDSEPIETAFTDAAFLGAVRKVVGKTNGEHIYYSDVAGITKLRLVNLNIESLDGIEYFTGLKELLCYVEKLVTLDLSHNTNLEVLDCSYNPFLVSINVTNCPELRTLDCNKTALEKLDVRKNTKLTRLVCYETQLKTLDVSNHVLLEELDTYDADLVNLDVSNNPNLVFLDCSYNDLTELDLSGNTKLEELWVEHNKLTGLDLTNNPALVALMCYENYMDPEAPEKSIKGLAPLLPVLGEPSSKDDGDSWFQYYPQNTTTPPTPPTPPDPGISVTVPTVTPTIENPFTDVGKNDWFYNDVMAAYGDGLMLGTKSNQFTPHSQITRGMFVTILYRMEGAPRPGEAGTFTDVPADAYFADAVAWASANGIVLGYKDGTFKPTDSITREQMAAIIHRYAEYKGMHTGASAALDGFADGGTVSGYAVENMRWAVGSGLIYGKNGNRLDPADTATRAETAAIMVRFTKLTAK